MAFVGMQPRRMHSPPIAGPLSITAVFAPYPAAVRAAAYPALPPPKMMTSYGFIISYLLDYSNGSAQIPSMKNFLIALLLGGIIGAGAVWYVTGRKSESQIPPAPASPAAPAAERSPSDRTMEDIKRSVSNTADSVRTAIDAKLDFLHLKAADIKQELAAKGKVVRREAREAATTVKDAALDAKITASIKAKYALDKDVSALDISVNTTDGVVTLSGTASSYDTISKAMLIAMETEGVRQVVSTIQVK